MDSFIQKVKQFLIINKNNKKILYLAVIVVAAITAFLFLLDNDDSTVIDVNDGTVYGENENSIETENSAGTTSIFVDISGEVAKPGVYELDGDTRLFQLIEKAGGLCKDANIDSINQAEILVDGQKIVIPSRNEELIIGSNGNNGLININQADIDKLEEIKGVGPATAQKIIDYRNENGPFTKIEDIKNVSGIGEKTFEKLKDSICV